MKTILVTGGGGFIGSNLVAGLLERNTHHIVVCDRFGTDDKWRNLVNHPVWEIITPEMLPAWLEENKGELELIYHIGGIASTTEKNIDLILRENLTESLMLWRWCNTHAVRLIYTSSSATYGKGEHGFDDTMDMGYLRKLKPLSGYGWSKHLFDMHVARSIGTPAHKTPQWVGLKVFNAYGPNEYHKDGQASVVSQSAPQAIQGAAVRLFRSYNPKYPDGGQMRDVIYVKDCVRVLMWFLDNPKISGLFNLGTGRARSFNDMAKAIFAALGREPRIHYNDMPDGLVHKYQYFTEAKMDRLRAAGYADPFTSLEEGVKDFVQGYLMKDDPYL